MKKKKDNEPSVLNIKHEALAKKMAIAILEEMIKSGLPKSEIAQVLSDICKITIFSEAMSSKEDALYIVEEFTSLACDVTTFMMNIVQTPMPFDKEGDSTRWKEEEK